MDYHERLIEIYQQGDEMTKQPRGFWCEFNAKGQCRDLIEGDRNDSPGSEYVWIQEGVEELEIYKRACESMAEQFIHPKMTGLEMAKMQLGEIKSPAPPEPRT